MTRKPLMILAALAMLPLPAVAQRAPAAAGAKAQVSAEEQAELERALARGRALFQLEDAARNATREVRSALPDPAAAGITGWIAVPEGNGTTVTFYGREADKFVAIYRGQVLRGRVASPQIYPAGQRPELTGRELRMAMARATAVAEEKAVCGPELNAIVLPPRADGPVLVYRLSPRMTADKIPAGGHYRATIAPDGSLAESVTLGGACADLSLTPARGRGAAAAPLRVAAPAASVPSELHVLLSLWSRRPVIVATGAKGDRLWQVTPQGITAL